MVSKRSRKKGENLHESLEALDSVVSNVTNIYKPVKSICYIPRKENGYRT